MLFKLKAVLILTLIYSASISLAQSGARHGGQSKSKPGPERVQKVKNSESLKPPTIAADASSGSVGGDNQPSYAPKLLLTPKAVFQLISPENTRKTHEVQEENIIVIVHSAPKGILLSETKFNPINQYINTACCEEKLEKKESLKAPSGILSPHGDHLMFLKK